MVASVLARSAGVMPCWTNETTRRPWALGTPFSLRNVRNGLMGYGVSRTAARERQPSAEMWKSEAAIDCASWGSCAANTRVVTRRDKPQTRTADAARPRPTLRFR